MGMGRQTIVGLTTTAISSVFDGYFFGNLKKKIEMRPALLYSVTQSFVGFSVIPKCVTLLFRIKFCFRAGLASDRAAFENNCVKTNKDRHILLAAQVFGADASFWQYKVHGDIRADLSISLKADCGRPTTGRGVRQSTCGRLTPTLNVCC